MGRRRRATQTGRGRRIVSTKHDVGTGDEMEECGPLSVLLVYARATLKAKELTKPSTRLLQSIFEAGDACLGVEREVWRLTG